MYGMMKGPGSMPGMPGVSWTIFHRKLMIIQRHSVLETLRHSVQNIKKEII